MIRYAMRMRIAVLPADNTGCGSYRLIWPAQVVQQLRPDWEISLYEPGSVRVASDFQGRLTRIDGIDPREIDLLILQRVSQPLTLKVMSLVQQNGGAVIVDSDDALWAIDPANQAHQSWNTPQGHWKYNDRANDNADLVTITTPYLAKRHGGHGRYEILPNFVPESVLNLKSIRDKYAGDVTIGWAGFTGTHPQDLLVCGDAIRWAMQERGAVVRVIGDAQGAERDWGLPEGSVDPIPPQKLGKPYFESLTSLDIGLVPLRNSAFNRGKSYLKALEYSAMGIPVIASPTPDNLKLSRELPILLADSPREWKAHLDALISDPLGRFERGQEARSIVEDRFTLEANGELWAEAWERAVTRRSRLSA